MERCDFSSVITIISDYVSESKRGNQSDLMYALFDTFATDEINTEETFDEGAVCRWVNGVRKISPRVTKYYADNNKKICLSSDIEQNILPMMYDSDMAVREIYNLVVYDTTISDGLKQELTAGYPFSNSKEKADFLCAILCFSMERNFIKREPEKSNIIDYGALSPFVKNLIYGAEVPKPCRYFCDRDGKQSELHFMLNEYGKVFLQGIPGIGKSELAKAYAQSFKKEYTNIIYINYSGSLKNDIIKLDFAEDYNANETEADRFRRHDRFLRSLKDDSLIIIDNFNTVASDDETLSTVLAYSCRVLFTTRSRFDEYNDTYTIEEIPDDELLGLMGSLYSEADGHSEILREIIHTVHNHTFAVELSARLLEVGILAPDQLLEKLRAEKAALDSEDKISAKKDGKSKKATYYTHIHTLFSLYKLSKTESQVMRNLALAPHNGVQAKLFALWFELKNMNVINDLIESGFVKELPGRMIALHPMIQEIAINETKPSVTNCNTLLKSIQRICLRHGDSFTDEHGRIFIYYPIKNLAEAVHKSEMSVKTAISTLEKHELIVRKRQGVGKANRIYVKFPVDRNLSVRQTENCPPDGKKTVCHAERKLSGRYIERDNKKIDNRMSKAYGKFQNVFLSDDDISILQRTVPPYREYVERLSAYMQSSGKSYADHAATIRSWYLRDNPPPPARNYESEENESL